MLERWTRVVLRYRLFVLAAWLAVLVVGVLAGARLPTLLSTSFVVPGTESERASRLLADSFGERPEGTFVVVFDVPRWSEELEDELAAHLESAARSVPTGRARELRRGAGVVYGEIATTLDSATAKDYTDDLREALAADGRPLAWVTGNPAIQHDVDPILREDRRRAEAVAILIALVILVAVFGLSLAVLIPFVFAACTVTATLALVYAAAHVTTMTTFAPTLVELIGLGLAIDYSLLVVHRFREEAATGGAVDDLVVRTMETAGRAILVSGSAVAIGLALLLFVPLPLIRSMGVAGFLVPVVSIAAVLTLQPVLLSLLATRGKLAHQTSDVRADDATFWARLAEAQIRRPLIGLAAGLLVLAVLSVPAFSLSLAPSSISQLPRGPESVEGFARLTDSEGPGAVTPTQVVVDTGVPAGSNAGRARAAIDRLADRLFRDPEVFVVASGSRTPYVDESARRARVVVVGRHEFGAEPSRDLVRRVRETLVPAAEFPPGVVVAAGGLAPQGVDFLERAYAALPWLILAIVAVTYVVLLRAFRSLVLPLEAVLLNLLTVAAVCGLLVVVFQWGVGERLGIRQTSEIEAWVPIFLFATLFGLSMDYEVFYVSRMREAWDESLDTSRAVVVGLARSGRVVTAAAAIMIVAFSGFVAGRLVGLQQLGLGLAAGILVDATLVRLLVLPSLMATLGRWNWWLPTPVARIARVEPSPLQP